MPPIRANPSTRGRHPTRGRFSPPWLLTGAPLAPSYPEKVKIKGMKRNTYAPLLALLVALAASASPLAARTKRKANSNEPRAAARIQAVPLPASDAVLFVELRRLLTEAVPRAFGNDAKRLADMNADIEQFKRRTGIDARQFDTLAVGARLANPREGVTKVDHMVAVARGKFDAAAVVAAVRAASGGTLSEQKHGGKTVYVLSVNDQLKLFGLLKMRVRELGVSVLSADTLAVGEPAAVRAAIDAQAGRGAVSRALLDAARQPGALIGFAGNIPAGSFKDIDTGMPGVDQSLASIRRFRGTVGMSATGFQVATILGTDSAKDAQRLSGTIEAVRQVAPALLSVAGERGQLANGAIKNIKVAAQGTDVQLRLDLAQSELAAIMKVL